MDRKAWNGGTRAATRATLIFVHMLRTLPLSDDACGFFREDGTREDQKKWARQGTSLRSRCQVSTMHTIHIEFANAMHDQLAGGRRQRHMICPTGGPLLSALVMAFGWTRAWVMDSVSLNWGPGGRV